MHHQLGLLPLRRSRSLILSFEDSYLYGFNFLLKFGSILDELDIRILSCTTQWVYPAEIISQLEGIYDRLWIGTRIQKLVDLGFVVVAETLLSKKESEYEQQWQWGSTTAYYHFSIKDPLYMTPEDTSVWLHQRIATTPSVPLYLTNDNFDQVQKLPLPSFDEEIFSVMLKRRSYRGFSSDKPITLEHLGNCLFSGLGITGFAKTSIPNEEPLPLKMTPSGGARNPYEAFIYVRNVTDLKKGIYHYSALDNTLGLVRDSELPEIGEILGGQPWFNNAAALILLVANFDRTMRKYPHPGGFRVALLEAGHIAQNILLTATAMGLSSAPTCAVSDSLAEHLLDLNSVTTKAVVYTIGIGIKSDNPTQADILEILPNPSFESGTNEPSNH